MKDYPVYPTQCVYETAFLVHHGEIPLFQKNSERRVFFIFRGSPSLYAALSLYNQNTPIPVTSYVSCLKALRKMMLAYRDGDESNKKAASAAKSNPMS